MYLKIIKSQKQITLISYLPKKLTKYLPNSGLQKLGQNKTNVTFVFSSSDIL